MNRFFQIRWFRKIIKKQTGPIPMDVAVDWKERLSQMYLFFAFCAFNMVVYNSAKNNRELVEGDKDGVVSALHWARGLNLDGNVKVFKMKGFHAVEEYEFSNEGKEINIKDRFL